MHQVALFKNFEGVNHVRLGSIGLDLGLVELEKKKTNWNRLYFYTALVDFDLKLYATLFSNITVN